MQKKRQAPSPALENRGVIATGVIDILREFCRLHFATSSLSETVEESLISAAIVIGQADGRPMTATDISNYLGYPRPTVVRKLLEISTFRKIKKVREGSRVCYTFADLDEPRVVNGLKHVFLIVQRLCAAVSKMDTSDVD